jgi:hypothetical protein
VTYDDPNQPDPEQEVSGPAGPAPLRRPNSIRRTATIDMTWPDGLGTQLRLEGHARDAMTFEDPGAPPSVIDSARAVIGVGPNRTIEDISVDPDHPGISHLVGARGGGHLRGVIDEYLPGERESGHPLYLLLDDVSGCSLILEEAGREGGGTHRLRVVGSLVNPDDPDGWHRIPDAPPVNMRRARRIDTWIEGHSIKIDAAFQDSAGDPDHGRVAIHEYQISAEADLRSGKVTSIAADPRILPFRSCTTATATAHWLVNSPLSEMRATVLDRLARANGCTHLNDALRALAEVPTLASHLRQMVES